MVKKRPSLLVAFGTWQVTEGALNRVKNLISIYDQTSKGGARKPLTPTTDILRAAVVLLHAILEEYVRHVAELGLPHADPSLLDDIPLVGQKRGERFRLGDLAKLQGHTVDSVIQNSIRDYLAKKSFSSVSEVFATLQAAGIETGQLTTSAKQLDGLIRRRHEIVHRGDQIPRKKGASPWVPRSITRSQVVGWTAAVERFVTKVDTLRDK